MFENKWFIMLLIAYIFLKSNKIMKTKNFKFSEKYYYLSEGKRVGNCEKEHIIYGAAFSIE